MDRNDFSALTGGSCEILSFLDEDYFWSGQGIRGKICLEVGQGFEVEDNLLLDIAVFTELLHNADPRRPHRWGYSKKRTPRRLVEIKPKALLVGDLLIAKAFEIASLSSLDSSRKVQWVAALSKTVATAVRGAVHELDFTVKPILGSRAIPYYYR